MSNYVLDASALLALLNNESGAKRVSELLSESVISAVNLCESVGKLTDAGLSVEEARNSIELLNLEVVPFDEGLAYQAAGLVAQTRKLGLSLGDRACLALGLALKKPVLTADHLWSRLKLDISVEVIRENSPRLR